MPRLAPKRRRRPLLERRVGRLEARLAVETEARRRLEDLVLELVDESDETRRRVRALSAAALVRVARELRAAE